jgi:hypothetical protein
MRRSITKCGRVTTTKTTMTMMIIRMTPKTKRTKGERRKISSSTLKTKSPNSSRI